MENRDKQIREYMQRADMENYEKIHLLEKSKIIDYFTGAADTIDSIDKTLIPATMITLAKPEPAKPAKHSKEKPSSRSKKRSEKAQRKQAESDSAAGNCEQI